MCLLLSQQIRVKEAEPVAGGAGNDHTVSQLFLSLLEVLMNTNFDNFKSWYADTLQQLYPERDSGFVILMAVFPLLERYLRHKSGLTHKDNLDDRFIDDLGKIFPVLSDRRKAWDFWNVYRNGILHQATLSRMNRKGNILPEGWLSNDINSAVSVESDGSFLIHPVLFSKHVLDIIENDFAIFEKGTAASTKLPRVKPHPTAKKQGAPKVQNIVLGTNTEL